ncbi:MAG: phosphoribosylanthranilate isomerase [Flavisolibacter sp.]
MKLKVCGITSLEQLVQLEEMGVDYAGMIFYEKSPRYGRENLKADAEKIKSLRIKKVGVFVNAEEAEIREAIGEFGLDAVQLHGDETPEMAFSLKDRVEVIKVFRMAGEENIDELVAPFKSACDYYLFDTATKDYGGSGKQFDWSVLKNVAIEKPFFLSGGIGAADAEMLKNFEHPWFFAADVNSRFETAPGMKDMKLIKAFKRSLYAKG